MAEFKPGALDRLVEDLASEIVEGMDLDAVVQLAYETVLHHFETLDAEEMIEEAERAEYDISEYLSEDTDAS